MKKRKNYWGDTPLIAQLKQKSLLSKRRIESRLELLAAFDAELDRLKTNIFLCASEGRLACVFYVWKWIRTSLDAIQEAKELLLVRKVSKLNYSQLCVLSSIWARFHLAFSMEQGWEVVHHVERGVVILRMCPEIASPHTHALIILRAIAMNLPMCTNADLERIEVLAQESETNDPRAANDIWRQLWRQYEKRGLHEKARNARLHVALSGETDSSGQPANLAA